MNRLHHKYIRLKEKKYKLFNKYTSGICYDNYQYIIEAYPIFKYALIDYDYSKITTYKTYPYNKKLNIREKS